MGTLRCTRWRGSHRCDAREWRRRPWRRDFEAVRGRIGYGGRCGRLGWSLERWRACRGHATTLVRLDGFKEHIVFLVFSLSVPAAKLRVPAFDGLHNMFAV